MQFKTNLVLVTGAVGWLGISLVKALVNGLPDCPNLQVPKKGLRIRCLVLPGQDTTELRQISKNIDIVSGDLRSLKDCDYFCQNARGAILFHTAGIIHPRRVKSFYEVNFQGTKNLLNSAIKALIQRAIIVSSNSPCGCNPHPDHLFDEASPYNPYMNYGKSKMLMEIAVRDFQKSGQIETVIIRAPWFYGPNQPPRQTLFFRMIRDGKAPIIGTGKNLRSMVYIDNLCQGIILSAIIDGVNGETYWIADEKPYSMNEIIGKVKELLENEFSQSCSRKQLKLPNIVSEIALIIDMMLQSLGLYHQKIHVLSEMNKNIACSIVKAKREMGYRPLISLEEGMRRSIKWILSQQANI